MEPNLSSQAGRGRRYGHDGHDGHGRGWGERGGAGSELVTSNPKLKLLDQVREVMRLEHYTHVLQQGGCAVKSPLDAL